jgi:hypothetical protein
MKKIIYTPDWEDNQMWRELKRHKKALKKLRKEGRRLVTRWIKSGKLKLPDWEKFINS